MYITPQFVTDFQRTEFPILGVPNAIIIETIWTIANQVCFIHKFIYTLLKLCPKFLSNMKILVLYYFQFTLLFKKMSGQGLAKVDEKHITYLTFREKYYQQMFGIVMDYALSLSVANIFR